MSCLSTGVQKFLENLFNIEDVNLHYPGDYPLTSWFSIGSEQNLLIFQTINHSVKSEMNSSTTCSRICFWKFDQLFGEDLSESCIDVLWEQT